MLIDPIHKNLKGLWRKGFRRNRNFLFKCARWSGMPSSTPLLPPAPTPWVQSSWYRPTDGRRYGARLQQNLFGEWVLLLHWGTIHSNRGGRKEWVCQSYDQGLQLLAAVAKRRLQRGYVAVD